MQQNHNIMLRTVADELVDLVKKSNKISIEDAAKKLNVPLKSVEALVDFLVEEKVFGIEYKFTTPYIYLYKEYNQNFLHKGKGHHEFLTKVLTKDLFYEKAKGRNLSHDKVEMLWRKYLSENLDRIKEEFWRKSKEKGIPPDKIEELWQKYLRYLA